MIYFIEAIGLKAVKIGRVNDLNAANVRIQTLQVASPAKLRLLHLTEDFDEETLHNVFTPWHIRGEWFAANNLIKDFVKILKSGDWEAAQNILNEVQNSHRSKNPQKNWFPARHQRIKRSADRPHKKSNKPLVPFVPDAVALAPVKSKLKSKGFTVRGYARMIHAHPSSISKVIRGQIGGELRERFFTFLKIPESERPPIIPTRLGNYVEAKDGPKGRK